MSPPPPIGTRQNLIERRGWQNPKAPGRSTFPKPEMTDRKHPTPSCQSRLSRVPRILGLIYILGFRIYLLPQHS